MKDNKVVNLTNGSYRRIYSGFVYGRKICSVSIEAEAWFWRVQALADDFGNLPGDAREVWLKTIGHRDVSMQRVEKWIGELVDAGLLVRYLANGEQYMHIAFWTPETQPGPKNGRRAQKYPQFEAMENAGESGGIRVSPGATTTHHNHNQNHNHNHNQNPPLASVRFDEFWNAYPKPKRIAKSKCEDKWRARKLDTLADKIIGHVRAMSQSEQWQKQGQQFVPNAETYLNQSRWETPLVADDDDMPKPQPLTEDERREYAEIMRQKRSQGVLSG